MILDALIACADVRTHLWVLIGVGTRMVMTSLSRMVLLCMGTLKVLSLHHMAKNLYIK